MERHPEIEVFLGGESACYAHVLCAACGGVLDDAHREPCVANEDRVSTIDASGDATLTSTAS